MLNLPSSVNTILEPCGNILLVGMGGNDIMGALPLYYTLLGQKKKVHLANLTHTDMASIAQYSDLTQLENGLYGAGPILKAPCENFYEGHLSNFFKTVLKQDKIVWMLERSSVVILRKAFERLIDYLQIDGIVFFDGGVDFIMKGDEGRSGLTKKFIDVAITLSATQHIESLNERSLAVITSNGLFGQDLVNQRIANLTTQGGCFGGLTMMSFMKCYQFFKNSHFFLNAAGHPGNDLLVKMTECTYEPGEIILSLPQLMFFNPQALAFNNQLIGQIDETSSYFDLVQFFAPYITRAV